MPSRTVRIGLAGDEHRLASIGHSLEMEAARRNLPLRLRRFEVPDPSRPGATARLVASARAAGFHSLHCTAPLLQELTDLIQDSSMDSDRGRLFDTVFLDDKPALRGCDAGTRALHDGLAAFLEGRTADHVLILGAGAEAQSAAQALVSLGVQRLTFHDPDTSRAASLANLMQQQNSTRCALLARTEGIFHEFSRPGMTRGWIDGIVHAPRAGGDLGPIKGIAPPLWLADMSAGNRDSDLSAEARRQRCAVLTANQVARHCGARVLMCSLEQGAGCTLVWPDSCQPAIRREEALRTSG